MFFVLFSCAQPTSAPSSNSTVVSDVPNDVAVKNSDLRELIISEGTTTITANQYEGYIPLESIVIPSSVTKIENGAFKNCINLKTVIIPDTVEFIGEGVFSGCSNLEFLTIPFVGKTRTPTVASSESVFGYIFGKESYSGSKEVAQYCEHSGDDLTGYYYYIPLSLKKVTITGGNYLLGCFSNCESSEIDATVKQNVKLEDYAFYNCGIKSITIPSSIEEIKVATFAYCKDLKSVTLPETLKNIDQMVFYMCTSLDTINIPNSITNIGVASFAGCRTLPNITLSSAIERIEEATFMGCESFTEITIPNSVNYIGAHAFELCNKLVDVYFEDVEFTWSGESETHFFEKYDVSDSVSNAYNLIVEAKDFIWIKDIQ